MMQSWLLRRKLNGTKTWHSKAISSLLATPCWRDPTRSKQLSRVAIFGFQFGLYHVVVPLSFLRSNQPWITVTSLAKQRSVTSENLALKQNNLFSFKPNQWIFNFNIKSWTMTCFEVLTTFFCVVSQAFCPLPECYVLATWFLHTAVTAI